MGHRCGCGPSCRCGCGPVNRLGFGNGFGCGFGNGNNWWPLFLLLGVGRRRRRRLF